MGSTHIKITATSSKVELVVDDYELFDYLDDLLTERGLEYEFSSEQIYEGRKVYKMHFGECVAEAELAEVVERLPQQEIERISALNNPGVKISNSS
ncbi:MAG: hypothetical protein AAGA54_06845 [Myxococcota bacterium]